MIPLKIITLRDVCTAKRAMLGEIMPAAPAPASALNNPALMTAALALAENRIPEAEAQLKAYLRADPFDVLAIRMLAEVAARIGRYRDAETLLRRALELAPDFIAAQANLATVLYKQNRAPEAIAALEALMKAEPDHAGHANLKAAALGRIGEFEEAIGLYAQILKQMPDQARIWMSYGHVLKTVGRLEDGIAAYRRAIALMPHLGEAWWSLANLKTVSFNDADIRQMQTGLKRADLSDEDRFHLDFALGKAFEDRREPVQAFDHYRAANALRRTVLSYEADETEAFVDACRGLFTPEFFAARQGFGDPALDPIFVIGMPRSGSTLIEQILASHSRVEGTSELPVIPTLARRWVDYPQRLATTQAEHFAALGAEYVKRTAIHRKSGRPFFIDKLPNNWAHVAFIHLILPNAKIIDARRHPMDCSFSNYRQHYARGQAFSYDLNDMGRYYRDYVRLMSHMDTVLPGRVHRVIHERLIEDPETEIRALLAACGLEFAPACLSFYENDRAVRTPSSEQVRRPINRDGVDAWRPFSEWLGPLEAALGPVLAAYPESPYPE